MFESISQYFGALTERFGRGWNLFWFVPSGPATLSLVRPLVGLLAIWWHSTYTADLLTFFGPQGLIQPALVEQWPGASPGELTFSYFNLATSSGAVVALHWLGLAVLVLFTLGILTRLTTLAALAVVVSYIHRGPPLISEFEPVLAMVLFYLSLGEVFSLFEQPYSGWLALVAGGACGEQFSIDSLLLERAARRPDQPAWEMTAGRDGPLTSVTIATRLLQVHLAAIHALSAFAMLGNDAWWSGEAVWWLIARPEEHAFVLAPVLDAHPYVINVWTLYIMFVHLAFALLVWNRLARPIVLACAALMWILVAVASGLYLYSGAMFVASLVFVSPEAIEDLKERMHFRQGRGRVMPANGQA
jgi:hypothetical protein